MKPHVSAAVARIRSLGVALAAAALVACSSTSSKPPTNRPSGLLAVRGRSADAKFVDLADGSRWAVQPAGQGAALRWGPQSPVRVVRTGRTDWPFAILDAVSGMNALVRPVRG